MGKSTEIRGPYWKIPPDYGDILFFPPDLPINLVHIYPQSINADGFSDPLTPLLAPPEGWHLWSWVKCPLNFWTDSKKCWSCKYESRNFKSSPLLRTRKGGAASFHLLSFNIWVWFSLPPTGHLSNSVCACAHAMTGPDTQLPVPWTAHVFIPAAIMQRIQECLGDFHTCSKGGNPQTASTLMCNTVTWRSKNRVKGTRRDHACAWCWRHVVIIEIIKVIKRGLIESLCLLG